MRKRFTLLFLVITFSGLCIQYTFAKTAKDNPVKDSVGMGFNYSSDVYYSMSSGTVKTVSNTDWDISIFVNSAMLIRGGAGIYINSANGVELSAYPKGDTSSWSTVDTSGFYKWLRLENSYVSWNNGAFNVWEDVSNFIYGWGKYDPVSHLVKGDSIFIMKLSANKYKKVIIRENNAYPGVTSYYIRSANLDGTNDTTAQINYGNYVDRNMVYYSFAQKKAILDKEPQYSQWDLVFTCFLEQVAPGMFYRSIDILSNPNKVKTAKLTHVDPDTVNFHKAVFNTNISTLGHSWKKVLPGKYIPADSTVYFVKDSATYKIYRLKFLTAGDYTGKKVIFTKEDLVTSVSENKSGKNVLAIYPNPVKDNINLIYDFKTNSKLTASVYNLLGEKILESQLPVSANGSQLSVFNIPSKKLQTGTYLLMLKTDNSSITKKFVVSK